MLKDVKDIQTQSFLIFIIFKDLLDTFNNRLNHSEPRSILFPSLTLLYFSVKRCLSKKEASNYQTKL